MFMRGRCEPNRRCRCRPLITRYAAVVEPSWILVQMTGNRSHASTAIGNHVQPHLIHMSLPLR